MAPSIAMNSPEQAALQESVRKDMIERGWQAEDDAPTLAEYAVIMLINGKPEDQVDAELSEIIPDYDFGFSKWLFTEAERIALGAPPSAPAPVAQPAPVAAPAPVSPPRQPISPPQSPRTSPNGTSLKRQRSASPSGANKAPRTGAGDAPNAPRAMRDRPIRIRGRGGERSLLDRMGPRVQRQNDEIQARIDAITGGPVGMPQQQQQQQQWQGSPMANGIPPGMTEMAAMEMQKQWQEMMAMQMAMMQQMAMMNGGMPFVPPGAVNPALQGNAGRGDGQRGRGRGRGRGGHNQGGHMQNTMAETTPAAAPATAPAPAPAPQAAPPPAPKPAPAPAKPTAVTTIPGTLCKFGLKCSNPTCPYAHPSPAATVETGLVLSDELCADGKECKNPECVKVHPSPAKPESKTVPPAASVSQGVMCRFGAKCTRPGCVFTHPWDQAAQSNTPCRYGINCTRADCIFAHPPGRQLPSVFHKGLDSTTTTSNPSKLNGAAAPFVSKNISQTFNNSSSPAPTASATEAVAGAAQATVAEAAGAAAETLQNAVDATKETIAKVETTA